jgi:hypothetical protein
MKLTNKPHVHDAFDDLNDVLQVNAALMEGPIYTVATDQLWETFLAKLPTSERGFHTCRCCRHFVERFGGMYTVDYDGVHRTVWTVEAPKMYAAAAAAMEAIVLQRASRDDKLAHIDDGLKGTKSWTGNGHTGQFSHFHLTFNRQDRKKVIHYSEATERTQYVAQRFAKHMSKLDAAVTQLADQRVTPMLDFVQRWFAANGFDRRNLLANAHDGLTHWSSSVLGSMVDDIEAGRTTGEVVRAAKAKLGPLAYQRPQTVKDGQIAAAEKLFAEKGWAASLKRRNLLPDEIPHSAYIWQKKGNKRAVFHTQQDRIFGHLASKQTATALADTPSKTMSWNLFVKSILPKARAIEVATAHFNPVTLTTAVDMKAPAILRYDKATARNPVAWWLPHYSETGPAWSDVKAILHNVPQWVDSSEPTHADSQLLMLSVYHDIGRAYSGLFPELLSHELREVRHVIEAHNTSSRHHDHTSGTTCVKVSSRMPQPVTLRVETVAGAQMVIKIDRYE